MRAKTWAVIVGGMLVAASCGPELTVGDITGSGGGTTTAGSGGGGSTSGGTGTGGARSCAANVVDHWAHWTVPSDEPGAANYDTSVADVVRDKTTGLLWQAVDDGKGYTWQAAVDHCKALDLAGHCDWRLPTWMELFSLLDFGQVSVASTFPKMPPAIFWSSSVAAGAPPSALIVDFGIAGGIEFEQDIPSLVRCVR